MFQFGLAGWFSGYSLGCEPVDFSQSVKAIRVRYFCFVVCYILPIVLLHVKILTWNNTNNAFTALSLSVGCICGRWHCMFINMTMCLVGYVYKTFGLMVFWPTYLYQVTYFYVCLAIFFARVCLNSIYVMFLLSLSDGKYLLVVLHFQVHRATWYCELVYVFTVQLCCELVLIN